nr:adenylate/guanylate cyclase domain-containing protein [Spirochaetales bacterium]
ILDNLIAGDPMIYDTYSEIFITYVILIIGGIGLSAILAYSTPMAGGLGGSLCILATCALGYNGLFLHNRIIGITYPLITISLIFLCVTLFNFLYEGRRKRQMTNAFKRYVSPKIVKQVTQNPEALTLSGENRYLTVFFSDIKNFTAISETLPPEQLSVLMNEYLTAMSDIILEREGTVDKFIGDAIMAIWGAPLDVENQEVQAVSAALESIEMLDQLRVAWLKQGLPEIAIRIGLNSGEMRVGNFGSQTRFDYTVIGDNVYLAARLEGLRKNYGTDILISQTTKQAVENHFFSQYIDTVRVKGKDIPVRIYTPMRFDKAEQKKEEFGVFNRAIDFYLTRQFSRAYETLDKLNNEHQHKLYKTYMERCLFFQENPPDRAWNGVFTYTSK